MRKIVTMIAVGAALVVSVALGVATQGAQTPRAMRAEQENKAVQSVKVELTEKGYQPASFKLRRGVPARITFIRRIEETCGKAIAIPEYNIRRPLPLNEPVVVEFTPNKSGRFNFTCGMGMLRGTVIVQ